MNLRFKLMLIISGFVSLSIGVAVLIGLTSTHAQVEKFANQSTEEISKTLKEELNRIQATLRSQARLLADRQGTSQIFQADRATISDHLQEQTSIVEADWIAMTDAEGKIIGQSKLAPFTFGQHTERCNVIKDALLKGEKSGLYSHAKTISAVSARVMKIGEYVRATIILGKFVDSKMLHGIVHSQNTEVSIGTDLAATVSTGGLNQLDLSKQIIQSRSLTFEGLNGNEPGRLTVYVLKSALAEPFQPVLSALEIAFVVTTLLAGFGSFWISKGISKPLEGLSAYAFELKQGNWPDPIHHDRHDEIGQLELAFDEMTANLRANKERMLVMLDVDPLTELLNYRAFRTRLRAELSVGTPNLQFALIDLDQFEKFNQENGDVSGDEMLIQFAEGLRTYFPEVIALGRIGGDEFAILSEGRSIEHELQEFLQFCREKVGITFSAGLVNVVEEESRGDLVLLGAEIAVSQVKNSGRNGVRIFSESMAISPDNDLGHLQKSSYGAVLALAEAVDAKDEYTRGHSTRVATYARDLAIAAGYDEGFVNLVFVTGTLHDVGKIGVPDAVLKKTDRLTDEEFELIKLHPVLGEKIVNRIPELAETLPGVRSHHERIDGKGYPDGLEGDEIPLLARILSIADSYDAMTSDRPYRKGMPVEKALSILDECCGTQFDSDLCKKFVDIMNPQVQQMAA
jgi:diguanylate cyclase (GGDEF)-like protein